MNVLEAFSNGQIQLIQAEKDAEMEQVHPTTKTSDGHSPWEVFSSRITKIGCVLVWIIRHGYIILLREPLGMRTGLGGKSLVDFERDVGGSDALPAHTFRSGDIVSVQEYNPKTKKDKITQEPGKLVSGVVYKVTDQTLTLSFSEELPDVLSGRCTLYVF